MRSIFELERTRQEKKNLEVQAERNQSRIAELEQLPTHLPKQIADEVSKRLGTGTINTGATASLGLHSGNIFATPTNAGGGGLASSSQIPDTGGLGSSLETGDDIRRLGMRPSSSGSATVSSSPTRRPFAAQFQPGTPGAPWPGSSTSMPTQASSLHRTQSLRGLNSNTLNRSPSMQSLADSSRRVGLGRTTSTVATPGLG